MKKIIFTICFLLVASVCFGANVKLGSEWDNYGTIYTNAGSGTQAHTSTPLKLDDFETNGTSSAQVTADHTDDSLTITDAGDYWVFFQASFSGATGKTWGFELYADGVAKGIATQRKLGSTDIGSCSFGATVALAAGDIVTVYGTADTDTGTFKELQLVVKRLK